MSSPAGLAVDAAVALIEAGLDDLADVTMVGLSDGELLGHLRRVHSLLNRVDGLSLGPIHEAEARGVAEAAGATSTKAWLVHECRLRPATAGRKVRLAQSLHLTHPDVREAVAAGQVSTDHADVIRTTLAALPAELAPSVMAEAETVLLGHARVMDPARLTTAARHLGTVLDPDGAAAFAREEERLRPKCGLNAVDLGTGLMRLSGAATVEQWAWLSSGIDPLATRAGKADQADSAETADGPTDPRPLAERRLDALIELVRIALESPDVPESSGAPPTIVVTVPLSTLAEQLRLATVGELPHLDLDLPSAADSGCAISPANARRLACDAKVIPVLLGTGSEPLDVGRAAYTVPTAMRRAVVLRDRTCRFPGCHRQPRRCHVHHIQHWADGGATPLPNLVLLCSFHHHEIHRPDAWRIHQTPHGPQFVAPQWIRAP